MKFQLYESKKRDLRLSLNRRAAYLDLPRDDAVDDAIASRKIPLWFLGGFVLFLGGHICSRRHLLQRQAVALGRRDRAFWFSYATLCRHMHRCVCTSKHHRHRALFGCSACILQVRSLLGRDLVLCSSDPARGLCVDSDVLVRFDTIQSTDARVAAFNDAYCENTHKDLCWNRRHELAWQQLTLDWDEDSCTQLELRSNHSLVKSVLDNPELDKVHKALCTPPGRTTDDAGSDARVFKVVRKVHVELCDPVAISWCSSPPMNDSAASPFECFGGLSLRKTYEHWVTALSIYRAALVLFVALGLLTSAVFSFWRFHKK